MNLFLLRTSPGKESWKDVKGYEGSYKISSYGRVKSFMVSKLGDIIGTVDSNGYPIVSLKGSVNYTERVHRLVAKAFLKNPFNKETVNHKDGNKGNNCYLNLEWATYAENNSHAVNMGLITDDNKPNFGTDNGNSVLTKYDVKEIRSLKGKKSNREIGEMFNVGKSTIQQILTNKTWINI